MEVNNKYFELVHINKDDIERTSIRNILKNNLCVTPDNNIGFFECFDEETGMFYVNGYSPLQNNNYFTSFKFKYIFTSNIKINSKHINHTTLYFKEDIKRFFNKYQTFMLVDSYYNSYTNKDVNHLYYLLPMNEDGKILAVKIDDVLKDIEKIKNIKNQINNLNNNNKKELLNFIIENSDSQIISSSFFIGKIYKLLILRRNNYEGNDNYYELIPIQNDLYSYIWYMKEYSANYLKHFVDLFSLDVDKVSIKLLDFSYDV